MSLTLLSSSLNDGETVGDGSVKERVTSGFIDEELIVFTTILQQMVLGNLMVTWNKNKESNSRF